MNLTAILGNFSLILFVLTVVTGVIWCLDHFYLAKVRRDKAKAALAEFDARVAALVANGVVPDPVARGALVERLNQQPWWMEYSGSLFPVIAIVFFVRSFLYEPFKIPSSSMVPTLHVGDLILVNKFTYGVRLPIINKKIVEVNAPKRGDVVVFKYPKDTSLDYIKRVVGVAGDTVSYKNKRLTVNGQVVKYAPLPEYLDEENLNYYKQFSEDLLGAKHNILNDDRAPTFVSNPDNFLYANRCTYDIEGFTCTVPAGHYFMMGDNRDNSLDSRYWGFVADQHIVGKAFFIWMNLSDIKRVGSFH